MFIILKRLVFADIYVAICAHTHHITYAHTNITRTHACTHTRTHTHTHTHTHALTCTHTHTHTHRLATRLMANSVTAQILWRRVLKFHLIKI